MKEKGRKKEEAIRIEREEVVFFCWFFFNPVQTQEVVKKRKE